MRFLNQVILLVTFSMLIFAAASTQASEKGLIRDFALWDVFVPNSVAGETTRTNGAIYFGYFDIEQFEQGANEPRHVRRWALLWDPPVGASEKYLFVLPVVEAQLLQAPKDEIKIGFSLKQPVVLQIEGQGYVFDLRAAVIKTLSIATSQLSRQSSAYYYHFGQTSTGKAHFYNMGLPGNGKAEFIKALKRQQAEQSYSQDIQLIKIQRDRLTLTKYELGSDFESIPFVRPTGPWTAFKRRLQNAIVVYASETPVPVLCSDYLRTNFPSSDSFITIDMNQSIAFIKKQLGHP